MDIHKERIMEKMDKDKAVKIVYTNYKGETGIRSVIPQCIIFDCNEWHKEPQWLMTAYDLEKEADRTFALKDIKSWYTEK